MSKIKNVNVIEAPVMFPKKEKAYAIVPHDGIPFKSAVIGITYPSANYAIRRSPGAEVCLFEYVISGEGEILIDGRWHKASAGDFYILSSKYEHEYRSSAANPWKKLWVNYVAGYMPAFLASYGIEQGIYHSETVKVYFEDMIELAKASGGSDETPLKISDKIHKIARVAAMQNKNTSNDELGIKKLIAGYVHKKLNLDELAEALHMSKSNIIRIFKREYGITPYEYLISLKLETAKVLLKDTKLTVKEIADKVAISDEHYFSSLFLRKVGARPGSYRKTSAEE